MQSFFSTSTKKKLLAFVFFLAPLVAFSQDGNITSAPGNKRAQSCPMAYIGLSTGINNETGLLGFNIDIPVLSSLSIGAGAGLSSWGTKVYGEVRYYLAPCQRGWAFGAGITHNTGLSNFNTQMETISNTQEPVVLNLNPQSNAFIKVYRFWNLGRAKNRFYTAFGWSVPITTPSYDQLAGEPLSQNSINEMKILEPGGLVLSLGFSFGLH